MKIFTHENNPLTSFMSAINPRKHAIDTNFAKLTVHYNKYEHVWDKQV